MVKKSELIIPVYMFGILFTLIIFLNSGCSRCSRSGRLTSSGTMKESEAEYTKEIIRRENEGKSPETREDQLTTDPGNLTLNELFIRCKPAVFMITTSDGTTSYQGTGFFISEKGIAISNYHLFEKAGEGMEKIVIADGSQSKINEILTSNSTEDYVVFRVATTRSVAFLNLSKKEPEVGEGVFTIGNPYGLEHTLSQGIVSAYRQERTLIQTTAEFAPGSSGGPLLNMKGEVIGITTATLGEANINFAVNINLLYLNRFLRN